MLEVLFVSYWFFYFILFYFIFYYVDGRKGGERTERQSS